MYFYFTDSLVMDHLETIKSIPPYYILKVETIDPYHCETKIGFFSKDKLDCPCIFKVRYKNKYRRLKFIKCIDLGEIDMDKEIINTSFLEFNVIFWGDVYGHCSKPYMGEIDISASNGIQDAYVNESEKIIKINALNYFLCTSISQVF